MCLPPAPHRRWNKRRRAAVVKIVLAILGSSTWVSNTALAPKRTRWHTTRTVPLRCPRSGLARSSRLTSSDHCVSGRLPRCSFNPPPTRPIQRGARTHTPIAWRPLHTARRSTGFSASDDCCPLELGGGDSRKSEHPERRATRPHQQASGGGRRKAEARGCTHERMNMSCVYEGEPSIRSTDRRRSPRWRRHHLSLPRRPSHEV